MTTTLPYSVTEAVGLPETHLPDSLLERLPHSVAPAPWEARCQVVSWLHAVDEAALEAFPEAIRPDAAGYVAWALVQYSATPVGPYSEIAATLLADSPEGHGHIPFIVVDSLSSIVGGRGNWLLPKALARFAWTDDGRSVSVEPAAPETPAWSISVTYEPLGDAMETSVPNHLQQVATDGSVHKFSGEMTGSLFAATVNVEGHADGPLASLLVPGRYDGTVISRCTFDVGPLAD
jgi:acetoacetate decarboxylase